MITNICVRCGASFESKRAKSLCPDCSIGHCLVCGKEFNRTSQEASREFCSRKCSSTYKHSTGEAKQIGQKIKNTKIEKYGSAAGPVKVFKKICKYCGKEFETTSTRRQYCFEPHYGPCPVCGKMTLIKDMSIGPQSCSEACRQEKIRRTTLSKYGSDHIFKTDYQKEKAKQTMMEKYGVEHYLQSPEGKDRVKQTMLEKYGVEYALQSEEIKEKSRETNQSRYGVPYATMNPEIKSKAKASALALYGGFGFGSKSLMDRITRTMEEKYGCSNPMQNADIRLKAQKTLEDKYGEHPFKNDDIRESKQRTSLEKYGTSTPSESEIVKLHVRESNIRKFGVANPFQSEEIKKKIADSNITKYGVSNPMKNTDIQLKAQSTNLLKYGKSNFKGSDLDLIQNSNFDKSKLEVYKKFRDHTEEFLKSYSSPPTIRQLIQDTGTNLTVVSFVITKHNCQHLVQYTHVPYMEQEIVEFLSNYVDASTIKQHDRIEINPKEIDIYLPDMKLGIECNPTYTHNSSRSTHFDTNLILDPKYHLDKTIECESKGIRLIHVFGYQWTNKPNIVKSMILNAIGHTPDVYYARKLELREVSNVESKLFLNENHIQGYTTSKVRLGLYHQDKLVCLMTFSHKRGTMGHSAKDTTFDWELTRFCNLAFSRCVGGASKLFKYFVDNYHPSTVVSFSNRSYTSGGMYSELGFSFDSYVDVGYVWVDSNTDAYLNRISCQKSKLKKLFDDPTIDVENKTESQIMEEHGFVKVYDSGLIKWIWVEDTNQTTEI